MTYEEARLYIEEISQSGSILGLTGMKNLMQELKNIQEKLKIIHIAGTNGKGSTGAFIESALIEAGYSVGRYTSPAVFEPLEVWRINRKNISEEDYAKGLLEIKAACERMLKRGMPQPTVFEVETALAFLYFYKKQCDYVLLEVGMGGETDATNLIQKPICSVITSISMDHMQFLGNSLKEIARAKTGIIKEGCPVVTGNSQKPEVMKVIESVAKSRGAELILAKEDWVREKEYRLDGVAYQHEKVGRVILSMIAKYQIENSNLAITVCKEVLRLSDDAILEGIRQTKWPGRFEIFMEKSPYFILDGAHNEDAAEKLAHTLRNYFTNFKITYIIGVLADKEHVKMLEHMLPLAERVYTITPPNKRALSGELLAKEVRGFGKEAIFCQSIREAVHLAMADAVEDEKQAIAAFGSLSYLGELKKVLQLELAECKGQKKQK